jgi:hypothetical protein
MGGEAGGVVEVGLFRRRLSHTPQTTAGARAVGGFGSDDDRQARCVVIVIVALVIVALVIVGAVASVVVAAGQVRLDGRGRLDAGWRAARRVCARAAIGDGAVVAVAGGAVVAVAGGAVVAVAGGAVVAVAGGAVVAVAGGAVVAPIAGPTVRDDDAWATVPAGVGDGAVVVGVAVAAAGADAGGRRHGLVAVGLCERSVDHAGVAADLALIRAAIHGATTDDDGAARRLGLGVARAVRAAPDQDRAHLR